MQNSKEGKNGSHFNKVAGLLPVIYLLNKRLWYWCYPVDFWKRFLCIKREHYQAVLKHWFKMRHRRLELCNWFYSLYGTIKYLWPSYLMNWLNIWKNLLVSLREKCPNTELFLVCIFLYSVRIQENTDHKKLRIWTLFTQCLFYLFIWE